MDMMVFVTICKGMIAVSTTATKAEEQVSEMIRVEAAGMVSGAYATGETRTSVRVRVCHVKVNQ